MHIPDWTRLATAILVQIEGIKYVSRFSRRQADAVNA